MSKLKDFKRTVSTCQPKLFSVSVPIHVASRSKFLARMQEVGSIVRARRCASNHLLEQLYSIDLCAFIMTNADSIFMRRKFVRVRE